MHFILTMLPRWSAVFLLIFALVTSVRAETVPREYMIKAAFLYNFLKFVEWPAEAEGKVTAPIVIGVFGANPFGGELEKTVEGRTVRGRAIRVREGINAGNLKGVDLLFVPAAEEAAFSRIKLEDGHAVLTVGETDRFATLGGVIVFCVHDGRLCFEVNGRKATEAGLKVSAQLLKLSR